MIGRRGTERRVGGAARGRRVGHPSPRRALPRALATAVLLGAIGAACHADSDASEPLTIAEQRALVAADSAAGDAAALAALPPALELLRLDRYLTNQHLAATEGAFCHVVDAPGAGGGLGLPSPGERRRVELPLPDSSHVVVGARTDASLVALEYVEVQHYAKGQRVVDRRFFQWRAQDDVTNEVRWPEELNGREELAPQPAGGPVPRTLRALGRILLQLDCLPEPPKRADDSTTIVLPATFDVARTPRP